MKRLFFLLFFLTMSLTAPDLLLTREEPIHFINLSDAKAYLEKLKKEIAENRTALGLTKGDREQEIIEQRIRTLELREDQAREEIKRLERTNKIPLRPTKTIEEEMRQVENIIQRP